jgi:phosphoserine phosphatase RsbU/P
MSLEDQALLVTRPEVAGIMLGTVFLLIGLAALGMAAVRGGGRVRILVWQGVFSALYGARILALVPPAYDVLPRWAWPGRPYVFGVITYLIILPALLFWLELSLGRLRRLLQATILAAALVAMAGVSTIVITGSSAKFMFLNKVLGIWTLLLLVPAIAVPGLARRFLVIESRVAAVGVVVFAIGAFYTNVWDFFDLHFNPFIEPIGFAAFILSIGYVAAERVFSDERRLLAIEDELAIAREIQNSILPSAVPEVERLKINAAYQPMTAVAGDFYEFVVANSKRAGFLVADVSGHGVPAALIAAMMKIAVKSVVSRAEDPAQVLGGLNHALSGELRGQYVSAAYLWLDTETGTAAYSAAGHPPLLRWRDGKLEHFESNGLLFGVMPDSNYPVCNLALNSGDRFMLYTDGVTEPENAEGESFGEHKLEQVVRKNASEPPSVLSQELFSEIGRWQPSSLPQQDDMTLIIVDMG